jgi:hypothetical protein
MENPAIVLFHQGWADIINSLPLLKYYKGKFPHMYVIIRSDAATLVNYFLRDSVESITPIYIRKEEIDTVNILDYLYARGININVFRILFHGNFDAYRPDSYSGSFSRRIPTTCFVKAFYTAYDISYDTRITYFNFRRDERLENTVYSKFIQTWGSKYILHHLCPDVVRHDTVTPFINLNDSTDTFFDYIKVLENAEEIHLLDSVWAALLYLLQGHYGICSTIPITVYCRRGYTSMFSEPRQYINWRILS